MIDLIFTTRGGRKSEGGSERERERGRAREREREREMTELSSARHGQFERVGPGAPQRLCRGENLAPGSPCLPLGESSMIKGAMRSGTQP